MSKTRTLNVTDARRDLPKLLHRIAEGGGPIRIGARGKDQAVLVNVAEYEALRARRDGGLGWGELALEIVGNSDDLDRELRAIRTELNSQLEERAMKVAAPKRKSR